VSSSGDNKDKKIKELEQQVAQLSQQLEFLTRQIFGKRSEKGIPDHPDQLDLFADKETESSQESDGDESQGSDEPVEPKPKRKSKRPRKPRLPKDLPIEETVIDPDEVTANPGEWIRIGEEETDRLGFDPPRFYIKRITRPKYVPKGNGTDESVAPVIAALPPQLIERGLSEASFAAHIVISKYGDHQPLDRQSKINLERYKVDISKQTMCNTVGAVADWLRLIVAEMSRQMFDSGYVQIDETPIKYLKPGAGKTAQGYFWTVHAPGGDTVYHWKSGRAAECLKEIVPASFRGIIQCDGYAAYPNLQKNRKGVELCACLAHIRRKFWEAAEAGQDGQFNRWIMRQIQLLYRVEHRLREAKASASLRHTVRQSESRMIFNRIEQALKRMTLLRRFLPKSPTGKALSYALNHWSLLNTWLNDGRVEIDNNLVENKIRPTKLGAKNWLFIGAETAGWRSAVIYSIITSCRNHGIEPYSYLVDVLRRLPSMTTSQISEVTPKNWKLMAACG
jgi:transposase